MPLSGAQLDKKSCIVVRGWGSHVTHLGLIRWGVERVWGAHVTPLELIRCGVERGEKMPPDIVSTWTQPALLEVGVVKYCGVQTNGVLAEILTFYKKTKQRVYCCNMKTEGIPSGTRDSTGIRGLPLQNSNEIPFTPRDFFFFFKCPATTLK